MNISTQSGKRIDYIDAIKGFSILWVVIYHFQVLPDWLNVPYRMPLFFLMSGIFFRPTNSFKEFFVKKVNTLIVPFLFFCFLAILFSVSMSIMAVVAGGNFGFSIIGFFQGILKLFTIIPISDPVSNPLQVGAIWFLIGLFNIQMLYYGLMKISKNRWFLIGISLVLYFASHFTSEYLAMGSFWYWIYSMQFMVYYVLGNTLGPVLVKTIDSLKWEVVLSACCLAILLGALFIDVTISQLRVVIFVKTIAFISLIFVIFKNIHKWEILKPLEFFGQNSIVLLGTHCLFIGLFNTVINRLYGAIFTTPHWTHLVLFLFICLGNYLLILFFNKFTPALIGKKPMIKIS